MESNSKEGKAIFIQRFDDHAFIGVRKGKNLPDFFAFWPTYVSNFPTSILRGGGAAASLWPLASYAYAGVHHYKYCKIANLLLTGYFRGALLSFKHS